jgi:hypothetical protein
MKQGSVISLPAGSDEAAAVNAVKAKYAEKLRSPQGWYGNATVRIEADKDGKGGRALIVKAVASGFEVYGLIGAVLTEVVVKTGKFTKVA